MCELNIPKAISSSHFDRLKPIDIVTRLKFACREYFDDFSFRTRLATRNAFNAKTGLAIIRYSSNADTF